MYIFILFSTLYFFTIFHIIILYYSGSFYSTIIHIIFYCTVFHNIPFFHFILSWPILCPMLRLVRPFQRFSDTIDVTDATPADTLHGNTEVPIRYCIISSLRYTSEFYFN